MVEPDEYLRAVNVKLRAPSDHRCIESARAVHEYLSLMRETTPTWSQLKASLSFAQRLLGFFDSYDTRSIVWVEKGIQDLKFVAKPMGKDGYGFWIRSAKNRYLGLRLFSDQAGKYALFASTSFLDEPPTGDTWQFILAFAALAEKNGEGVSLFKGDSLIYTREKG